MPLQPTARPPPLLDDDVSSTPAEANQLSAKTHSVSLAAWRRPLPRRRRRVSRVARESIRPALQVRNALPGHVAQFRNCLRIVRTGAAPVHEGRCDRPRALGAQPGARVRRASGAAAVDGRRVLFDGDCLEQERIDWIELYIPSNPFRSLSNNLVPAVVVFSALLGIALIVLRDRDRVLGPLRLIGDTLSRAGSMLVALTPIGIFAIAGQAAGTLRLEEFERLQAFLLVWIGLNGLHALDPSGANISADPDPTGGSSH